MEDFKRNNNDSLSWKIPQIVIEDACQKLIDQGKVIIPRLLPLILIIEYAFYVYLKIILPDEMKRELYLWKIFVLVFLFAAIPMIAMYIIWPRIRRRLKWSHLITKKYFKWSDKLIPWKQIEGYWIGKNEDFSELFNIVFKSKRRLYSLSLPENQEYHPEIIQFVDSRVPEIKPNYPEALFLLSRKQHIFCWGFTLTFTILAAIVFKAFFSRQHLFTFLWIMLLCPGTISMALVLGKKFYKDKQFPYAVILNLVALHLFIAIFVLAELYKYHKIFEGG